MAEANDQAPKPYLSTQQIRLFSDGIIYNYAINFVEAHKRAKVSAKQLSGLQNAVRAGNWDEVFCYVNNRLNRKTTPKLVKRFYKDLKNQLNELRTLAAEPSAYLLVEGIYPTLNRRIQLPKESVMREMRRKYMFTGKLKLKSAMHIGGGQINLRGTG